MEEISIPKSLKKIGSNAFTNCTNLKSFSVTEGNDNFTADNGVFIFKKLKDIISYPISKEDESYKINEKTTSIKESAFYSNKYLKSLTLSDNINSIGEYAFYNTRNLTSLVIPENVEEIKEETFLWM